MNDDETLDKGTEGYLVSIDEYIAKNTPLVEKSLLETEDEGALVKWREAIDDGMKKMDKRRINIVAPFLKGQRDTNAAFRIRNDKLKDLRDRADSVIKRIIRKKNDAQKAKDDAVIAENRRIADDAREKSRGANNQDTKLALETTAETAEANIVHLEEAPAPTTAISPNSAASSKLVRTGAFIIKDLGLIPVDYLEVASARVRAAFKANPELIIPGITIDEGDAAWAVSSRRR